MEYGLKMKDLPISERPYEKLEILGGSNLSNAELLAIILKTGTKNLTCVQVAEKLLSFSNSNQGIEFLDSMEICDLIQIKGIGKVKAIQLKAVIELSKRYRKPNDVTKVSIQKPQDISDILMGEMKCERQEICKIIMLDTKNHIIKLSTVTKGTLNSNNVRPREIFAECLKYNSSSIIIAHNHPSGDCTPSEQDIKFTKNIFDIGKLVGIDVLDHIIFGNNDFCSLKESGKF